MTTSDLEVVSPAPSWLGFPTRRPAPRPASEAARTRVRARARGIVIDSSSWRMAERGYPKVSSPHGRSVASQCSTRPETTDTCRRHAIGVTYSPVNAVVTGRDRGRRLRTSNCSRRWKMKRSQFAPYFALLRKGSQSSPSRSWVTPPIGVDPHGVTPTRRSSGAAVDGEVRPPTGSRRVVTSGTASLPSLTTINASNVGVIEGRRGTHGWAIRGRSRRYLPACPTRQSRSSTGEPRTCPTRRGYVFRLRCGNRRTSLGTTRRSTRRARCRGCRRAWRTSSIGNGKVYMAQTDGTDRRWSTSPPARVDLEDLRSATSRLGYFFTHTADLRRLYPLTIGTSGGDFGAASLRSSCCTLTNGNNKRMFNRIPRKAR